MRVRKNTMATVKEIIELAVFELETLPVSFEIFTDSAEVNREKDLKIAKLASIKNNISASLAQADKALVCKLDSTHDKKLKEIQAAAGRRNTELFLESALERFSKNLQERSLHGESISELQDSFTSQQAAITILHENFKIQMGVIKLMSTELVLEKAAQFVNQKIRLLDEEMKICRQAISQKFKDSLLADINKIDCCFDNMTTHEMEEALVGMLETVLNLEASHLKRLTDAGLDKNLINDDDIQAAYYAKSCEATAKFHRKIKVLNESITQVDEYILDFKSKVVSFFIDCKTRHAVDEAEKQFHQQFKDDLNSPALTTAINIIQTHEPTLTRTTLQERLEQITSDEVKRATHAINLLETKNIIERSAFNKSMEELDAKIQLMSTNTDKYQDAIQPAKNLQIRLIGAKERLLDPLNTLSVQERYANFKTDCLNAMNADLHKDMKILATHRDLKQMIANIVAMILSLLTVGLFIPVANKYGMFARKTDTMNKVEAVQEAVHVIVV